MDGSCCPPVLLSGAGGTSPLAASLFGSALNEGLAWRDSQQACPSLGSEKGSGFRVQG